MSLTFGSLFAGVGGFDLGFEQAGFDCRFQVEWDKHCQQVLSYRWPDVPKWWDVSEVNGADLPPVDVITYGFPCQDLSVAGRRAGLDGGRSGLFFEAVRIIKEMREATDGRYPTWAVAENVAGLLNADNGHAMGRCVDELAEAGSLVIEWCLVDAQWFGVPQRRRRVFLASCFDPTVAGRCPDPLFPVAPSSHRSPASSQQEREHTATSPAESTRGNSSGVTQTAFRMLAFGQYNDDDAASTIKSRDHKDHTDLIVESDTVGTGVAFGASSFGGFSEDLGCLRAANARESMLVADTLPIAFSHRQTLAQPSAEHFPALRHGGRSQAVAQPGLAVRRLTPIECERLMGWPDDHTLHRADGKTNRDSTRYKMCGNGVVAPVARWVAKQLRRTLEVDGGTVES